MTALLGILRCVEPIGMYLGVMALASSPPDFDRYQAGDGEPIVDLFADG